MIDDYIRQLTFSNFASRLNTELTTSRGHGGKDGVRSTEYGVRSHGVRSHGVRSHGVRSHGVRSHGVRSHGVRSHGVRSHGVRSHGVRSHGVRSHGVRSHGVRSHGVRSQDGVRRAEYGVRSPSVKCFPRRGGDF